MNTIICRLRGVAGFAAATAVALCAAAAPATAAAATTTLVGIVSGQCLDVRGNVSTTGASIEIWPCNGQANQAWEFTAAGEIRTLGGTRCLDAYNQGTTAGTQIISWTCNGQNNQKWQFNNNGTITGMASKLCMDVAGNQKTQGSLAQLAACQNGTDQQWARNLNGAADTQAPTSPTGLKTANLTCNSVTLSWNASADNVGVAFYDIYHDGQLITTVSGTTLSSALKLTPGATWGFYVNARDAAGNVSQASTSLVTAIPNCSVDSQAPTVPTGLTGSTSGTSANLSWKASTDNVGVTGYDVYRNDTKAGNTPNVTFTDSGLAPSTGYTYSVAARDAQGNVSARSTGLGLTTGGACASAVCSTSQLTTDTDIPWGLVTLPDGSILYSRRDAQDIVRVVPSTGVKTTVGTVPNVQSTDGEGGLLGLAVSPQFPASDPWLYIFHTSPTDNRLVRIKYVNGTIDTSTEQVLLSGLLRNKFHNGGRLRYGPDGKLYLTAGDAQNGANAQSLTSLNGKVLRVNVDGTIPSDNPFNNAIWSYGHRNPQGLAFDSKGRLWEQEFGDSTMDETNLILKGGNYGWPACEGTASQSGGGCATSGYIAPKYTYPVADGSCSGIAIVRDILYVACERGARLYSETISGDSLTNVQQLFVGTYGRLRTVEPTTDGGLWLTTSNQGDKDSVANNSNEQVLKVILGK